MACIGSLSNLTRCWRAMHSIILPICLAICLWISHGNVDLKRRTHTYSMHTMTDTLGVSYCICSKASIPGCQSCICQHDRPTHGAHAFISQFFFPFSWGNDLNLGYAYKWAKDRLLVSRVCVFLFLWMKAYEIWALICTGALKGLMNQQQSERAVDHVYVSSSPIEWAESSNLVFMLGIALVRQACRQSVKQTV